jgi:hypothetical protein
MLEQKWEYNETVHQLFVDFKKAYDSIRGEVLYNILIESEVPATTQSQEIHKISYFSTMSLAIGKNLTTSLYIHI